MSYFRHANFVLSHVRKTAFCKDVHCNYPKSCIFPKKDYERKKSHFYCSSICYLPFILHFFSSSLTYDVLKVFRSTRASHFLNLALVKQAKRKSIKTRLKLKRSAFQAVKKYSQLPLFLFLNFKKQIFTRRNYYHLLIFNCSLCISLKSPLTYRII